MEFLKKFIEELQKEFLKKTTWFSQKKNIKENHHKGIVERDSIGDAKEVSAGIHSVISEKILWKHIIGIAEGIQKDVFEIIKAIAGGIVQSNFQRSRWKNYQKNPKE